MTHVRSVPRASFLPGLPALLLVVAACADVHVPAAEEQPAGAGEQEADVASESAADESVFHEGGAIPWSEPDNGIRFVALYGEASAEGEPFAFRLLVQPGFEMGPHTHPITEHMTVLSGEFWVGIGEAMDRESATGYGPGSYVAIGAGVPAYMWAGEETVVQVHGVGPLTTEFVTPPAG